MAHWDVPATLPSARRFSPSDRSHRSSPEGIVPKAERSVQRAMAIASLHSKKPWNDSHMRTMVWCIFTHKTGWFLVNIPYMEHLGLEKTIKKPTRMMIYQPGVWTTVAVTKWAPPSSKRFTKHGSWVVVSCFFKKNWARNTEPRCHYFWPYLVQIWEFSVELWVKRLDDWRRLCLNIPCTSKDTDSLSSSHWNA